MAKQISLEDREALKKSFLSINSVRELASFLGITHSLLAYRIYKVPESKKYKEFSISKRSGGLRQILAPNDKLKSLQRKISNALYAMYEPLVYSHGFEKDKSIKTNGRVHIKQKYILNVDLKNFFPSINFGRVRGMFLAGPFHFPDDVATVLAQICCYKNGLPQGAPSSPIISNIICYRLDRQLSNIATKNKCYYSRYADDITFSTSINKFPAKLGKFASGSFKISLQIVSIIKNNGFQINKDKITFRTKYERQIVTGLVVNIFTNAKRKFISQVRAMLHAWDKYGEGGAETEYYLKYNKKNRSPERPPPSFRDILNGKIGFIGFIRQKEGEPDHLYRSLRKKFNSIKKEEDSVPKYHDENTSSAPLIITEGYTDWKHLVTALDYLKAKGQFTDLEIDFWKYPENVKFGDSILRKYCLKQRFIPKNRKHICIFDRDSADIVREMHPEGLIYKYWDNLVYSFCIPVPSHRQGYENISIEMFYKDQEVNTIDSDTGKRLFFTNQIKESIEINLSVKENKSRKREVLDQPIASDEFKKKIFATDVSDIKDSSGKSVAHSKSVFAANIFKKHKDFSNFDFSEFENIFNVIQEIVASTPEQKSQSSVPKVNSNLTSVDRSHEG